VRGPSPAGVSTLLRHQSQQPACSEGRQEPASAAHSRSRDANRDEAAQRCAECVTTHQGRDAEVAA